MIDTSKVPYIAEAYDHANEFLITASGQKNRNHLEGHVDYGTVSFAMQEILLDPQTSGGLLFAVKSQDAQMFLKELLDEGIEAAIVGEVTERKEKEIYLI